MYGVLSLVVLVAVGSFSCSVERFVTTDNPIYTGASVELSNPDAAADEAALLASLNGQIDVESTNERGAYWWFKIDTTTGGWLKKRFHKMLAQEPVYYDEAPLVRTRLIMQDYLKDHGYFGSDIEVDTFRPEPYRVEAKFVVETKGRSRIDSVILPTDSIEFTRFVDANKAETFVKQGDFYNIAALAAERVRLDQLAARDGFFEFAPSNMYYLVDSSAGPESVKVWLRLDKGSDSLALSRFRIGETYVFPEFTLGDTLHGIQDTVRFEHISILTSDEPNIHPEVIARRIGLREGDLYDRTIYENTVNQLLDLGVFKFVNYRFERRLTDSVPVLDQYIYLTQSDSRDVNVDVEAASQNGQQLGLGVQFRYGDRNLFGGAEDFKISLGAAAGPQPLLTQPDSAIFGQEYTFNATIGLPRIVGPFARDLERRAYYIPRTVANLRLQLTNRPDFQLSNVGLRLGYVYRANKLTSHTLYPLSVSYTSLIGQSDDFDALLGRNPRLQQAFADNAIIGSEYLFNYNEQSVAGSRPYWYVDGGIRTSGNVASLFATAPSEPGPKEVGGVALSQFFKAYVDGRRTFPFGESRLATRAYLGAALPYGNTDYIPFIEQFFAGGPNSVRAFPIRGLGPGRRLPADLDSTNVNKTGDLRLELNAEYRFPIMSFLEGAAFVDAGNVWLANEPSGEFSEDERLRIREGVFEFENFYKDLAVGVGIGLRLNFDVIIVRLDGAVPVHKPWLPFGDRLDFNSVNVFDNESRQENLRLHIAIGYPF